MWLYDINEFCTLIYISIFIANQHYEESQPTEHISTTARRSDWQGYSKADKVTGAYYAALHRSHWITQEWHISRCINISHFYQLVNSLLQKKCVGKISFTMDLWSNPNLTPYMAVTAHWIEATLNQTDKGPCYKLALRTDLVGFYRVPGRHTGDHLAQAFISITDRLGATSKVNIQSSSDRSILFTMCYT